VPEAYTKLLDSLADRDKPHQTLTLQLCFIFYLLLGQFVALFVWRLFAPLTRRWQTWLSNLVFGLYLLGAQVLLFLGWPRLVGAWQAADNVLLADIVVAVHLGLVIAVAALLILVFLGGLFGWGWTRNFWLRLVHLIVIEVVAGQALVGIECPLKTVERELRGGLGYLHPEPGKSSEFGRWCNQMLYHPGEPWLYMTLYVTVGLLVLLAWVLLPPRLPWRDSKSIPLHPGEPARSGEASQNGMIADAALGDSIHPRVQ
jgi:hypothetical protein